MSLKKRRRLMRSNAGPTEIIQESPKSLSCLKTRCRELTVGDYIRLVCDNDNSVLFLSGEASDSDIQDAKNSIFAEFAILSGVEEGELAKLYREMAAIEEDIFVIYHVISELHGMLLLEDRELAYKILNKCGVSTTGWSPETFKKDAKRALSIAKAKEVRLREKSERYRKLSEKTDKKTSESDIRTEMVAISRGAQLTINDDCNLATYAAYKKAHIEMGKAIEAQNFNRYKK